MAGFAALLVCVIQKHGHEGIAVFILVGSQLAGKLKKTSLSDFFKPSQLALTRLQKSEQPGGAGLRHIFVRGQGQFGKGNAIIFGNALQFHAFHDIDQRNYSARAAGPAGASRAMDIAFLVFRRLIKKNMRKRGDVDAPGRHIGSTASRLPWERSAESSSAS